MSVRPGAEPYAHDGDTIGADTAFQGPRARSKVVFAAGCPVGDVFAVRLAALPVIHQVLPAVSQSALQFRSPEDHVVPAAPSTLMFVSTVPGGLR